MTVESKPVFLNKNYNQLSKKLWINHEEHSQPPIYPRLLPCLILLKTRKHQS